jgi:phosphatidylglycerol:prolipoprotein diacylglycerol transferase
MFPRLFDFSTTIKGLSGFGLDSYFAMVAFGFIIGAILIRRWAKAKGIDPRLMTDFVIWMALFGVIGSKLLHVIADGHFMDYVHACTAPELVDWPVDKGECKRLDGVWDNVKHVCHPRESNCFAWIDITSGGFAFYGGFIGAALFSIYFIRKHRLPAGKIVDMAGWVLMLGVAWGRIGCVLAGCCFGARTDSCLGVVFPPGSAASRFQEHAGMISSYHLDSLPVHFTQAYESLACLLIAVFSYVVVRPRKRFDGQVFCIAAGLYAVARFMLEFIRNDERGGALGLSTSQLIAVLFIIVLIYLWRVFKQQAARTFASDPTSSKEQR